MRAPTPEDVAKLARRRKCPRCDLDKTFGAALCHSCRGKLPSHMSQPLTSIPSRDPGVVARALRAAANYFEVHFQSIRNFGGGKRR